MIVDFKIAKARLLKSRNSEFRAKAIMRQIKSEQTPFPVKINGSFTLNTITYGYGK